MMGKALGLVREVLFAAHLGGGALADAFSFASLMPRLILDAMFAAAISASFIPIFNTQFIEQGKKAAFELSNSFINITLMFSTATAGLAWWLAPWIVGVSSLEYANLAVSLLRIMLPLMIFSCAAFSLAGVLQSLGHFNAPAAMSLAANSFVILYYLFLFDSFGVEGLAVAFLVAWSLQLLVLLPSLYKCGYKYSPLVRLNNPALRKVGALVAPSMVFAWVLPLNLQINIFSVSHIVGGSTALNLSNTLYTITTGVFVLSLTNVMFPRLSREAAASQADFANTMQTCLRGLLYLLIPLSLFMSSQAQIIVQILFEHGEFTPEASRMTADVLTILSLGMVGFGAQTLLSRGCFAMQDGKTPLIAALVAVSSNAVISVGLVQSLGVPATALASTVAMTLCAVLIFSVLKRKNKDIWNKKSTKDIIKMAAASVISITPFLALGVVPLNSLIAQLITLTICGTAALAIYITATYAAGVQESRLIIRFIKSKIR